MILDILKTIGVSIIKRLFSKEKIETQLFKKTDFDFIIERDFELINEILLTNDIKKIDYQKLCNFFKCSDIKYFIKKIYAPNQSDPLGLLDVNNIYSEFGQLVIKCFKLENDKARNFSTKLFDILIEGCNETLTKLIDDGEIQSLNASFNYVDFREQYRKIREIYKSLNDYKSIPDYLSRKVCSAKDYNSSTILFLSNCSEEIVVLVSNFHSLKLDSFHILSLQKHFAIFCTIHSISALNLSIFFLYSFSPLHF